ncbi:MAG: hypothetical protein H0T60_01470 [Acidobacteria bacterium]|nr:hypothetical protein [Acidobacteriota bacterium]
MQTLNDVHSTGAHFEVTQGPVDPTLGGPFGILVGGAVISQQRDAFQQADPFFGFIAGYSSQVKSRYAK